MTTFGLSVKNKENEPKLNIHKGVPGKHASHIKYIIPTNGSVCRKVRPVLPNVHICAIDTY